MNLVFNIPATELLKTYRRISGKLGNNADVIFSAMSELSPRFLVPDTPSQYDDKHSEIERIIGFAEALGGRSIVFGIAEKIGHEAVSNGVPGVSATALIEDIYFGTLEGVTIRLTSDLRWVAEWTLNTPSVPSQQLQVAVEIYNQAWGETVPGYVLEYMHGGILLYMQGMYAVSVAMLSIGLEGTLRDVLVTRGYSFNPRVNSVDLFDYSEAEVGVNGPSYTVSFPSRMPQSAAKFPASVAPASSLPIRIKRVINPSDGKVSLKINAAPWFIDYWSSNVPVATAQKRVNGLGEALSIARNTEGFLLPQMLPTDIDPVLTTMRNNLIHLSGDALSTKLPDLDPTGTGSFTVGDFLARKEMVFDLITNVPKVISDQYLAIRKDGHLIS
jgi:hypothetical protein